VKEIDWHEYERRKREIQKRNLSPDEYEKAISLIIMVLDDQGIKVQMADEKGTVRRKKMTPLLPFEIQESQTQAILEALKSGRRLTPIQILEEFGSFRASGRIYDIRKLGFNVKTKMIMTPSGKRVAEYELAQDKA
jgi:hypothetical protein